MARLARMEVFAADEIAIVHVMNRTVRRCFFPGNDPFSGKNFDHRKLWLSMTDACQSIIPSFFAVFAYVKKDRSRLSLPFADGIVVRPLYCFTDWLRVYVARGGG